MLINYPVIDSIWLDAAHRAVTLMPLDVFKQKSRNLTIAVTQTAPSKFEKCISFLILQFNFSF